MPPREHDPARGKLRSYGRPYPGLELRIVDPSGEDVPVGEVGEIVLRSDMVMKGYWNNPEATRATFLAEMAGCAPAMPPTGTPEVLSTFMTGSRT